MPGKQVISFQDKKLAEEQIYPRTRPGDSPHATARRDLERYYDAIADALRTIILSRAEARLIVDVVNSWFCDPYQDAICLAMEVADGIRIDHLDDKWEINATSLLGRLDRLSGFQILAIVDAAKMYWAGLADHRDEDEDMDKQLDRVFPVLYGGEVEDVAWSPEALDVAASLPQPLSIPARFNIAGRAKSAKRKTIVSADVKKK